MNKQNNNSQERIELVDALRGFALLAIVLIHNLEHYNLYFTPENMPLWLTTLDKGLWDVSWFVIAGKAFSTFSLLFGFSFFIQLRNQENRGKPFRARFAWRMLMLILFAQFHAIFYNGDILLVYAITGLFLIPASIFSNRVVLILATILLLQPLEWWHFFTAPEESRSNIILDALSKAMNACIPVMKEGNFAEIVKSNITDGQVFNNLWQVSAGRLFQIPALFMFGMLLGRLNYFVKSKEAIKFWVNTAVISISMLILPLNILKNYANKLITNPNALTPYDTIMGSIWNFTFMLALISVFTLLWFYKEKGYKIQRFIVPYGKMSLTNYITQSIIGGAIYLNWGFGLYEYAGATLSLIIGFATFGVQLWFSKWWLSKHKQGPFEWLWKKLTWAI